MPLLAIIRGPADTESMNVHWFNEGKRSVLIGVMYTVFAEV